MQRFIIYQALTTSWGQVASNTSNNSYGIRQLYQKHLLDYELACSAKAAADGPGSDEDSDGEEASDARCSQGAAETDDEGAVEAAEILESLLGPNRPVRDETTPSSSKPKARQPKLSCNALQAAGILISSLNPF